MNEFGTEVLVPLAALVCIFGLPVMAFVLFRLLAHRERMAMIRNGLAPGTPQGKGWRSTAASSVRPPTPASAPPFGGSDFSYDEAQVTLRKGIRLTFIGFAILLGLSFIGYHDGIDGPPGWHPGPWLLGGLVPMFVGLAQVIIALLSGASLRPANSQSAPHFRADAPFQPDAPTPVYDTSYTYRPGDTQELRPPAPPPERRI